MKSKRSVSPVIATVLLIAIVIVSALLIFLWVKGFVKEAGQKMGKGAHQACDEVNLDASIDGTSLIVINNGNIPVQSITVEKTKAGSVESSKFEKILKQGSSEIYEIGTAEKIEMMPAIMVEVDNAKKEYLCKDKRKEVLAK